MPNVVGAAADAASPPGAWISLAVAAFVFLESTVLLGFLIHERGFAGATVDEIAEAAGVSRAMVFVYFPSRAVVPPPASA